MARHRFAVLAILAVFAVLSTGCPIESPRHHPSIRNTADHTIWFQTVASDLDRPGGATRVDPRETVAVDGHTDPCLSFDTLRITADDPAQVDDPDVLLEHDLVAEPICERETWVFDGNTLERAL